MNGADDVHDGADASQRDRLRRELQERRGRLADAARDRLERRLRADPPAPDAPAPGRTAGEPVASLAQRRMWYLEQLTPGTSAFNEYFALRLHGAIDAAHLEAALRRLVERHPGFRTGFAERDGVPVPFTVADAGWRLAVVDLRSLPAQAAWDQAVRLAEAEGRRPFALDAPPLFRATLVHLGDADAILVLVNHHIISDAWSRRIILEELGELYDASLNGRPPALPPLAADFGDYARAQRAQAAGPRADLLLAHWEERLRSAPPVLELPADRVRPAVRSHTGGRVRFAFDEAGSERIRHLARASGATVFMVLLAALKATLSRFSGQHDLVVGSAVADRPGPEFERVVGMFVETVVLRTTVPPAGSFLDLVAAVRETVLDALAHAGLPFERLVEALAPQRGVGDVPLIQVMVGMQSMGDTPLRLGGVAAELVPLESASSRFDLDIDIAEIGARIDGVVEYSAELFDRETVASMARFFERLVHAALDDPGRRLDELCEAALGEDDGVGVGPRLDLARLDDVVARFAERVRQSPEAPAVSADGAAFLSFRELHARARAIAAALAGAGATPGSYVGVWTERGTDMVASLLASLWVGAAYVPLDPASPLPRARAIARDAGIGVLLHAGDAPDLAPGVARVDLAALPPSPAEPPPPVTDGALTAYVIFTSGSTGKPKGVAVSRESVANFLAGMDALLGERWLGPAGTWLATTSVAFDMSVFDLFWPLVNGQRVVIHGAPGAASAADAILAAGVTRLQCTPSFLQMLADDLHGEAALARLELVITGGEGLAFELLSRVAAHSRARVYTCYGPTETTVYSSGELADPSTGAVALGGPLLNTSFYVLDEVCRRLPRGAAGELWIGGAGVAAGYVGAPGLTARRFRPDPFGVAGHGRMYRSGDRVRVDGNGRLRFLGRTDHQVKLRGHRIELGEVEHAVRRLPGVRDAAVLLHGAGSPSARLVAFVVADDEHPPQWYRAQAGEALPGYMVPARWVFLERMPLTHNDKLDRAALVALLASPEPPPAAAAAPVGTAGRMGALWARVLEVAHPAADADFFELGGHSLLATQLVARMREEFAVPVTLRDLLENRTIAQLSAVVDARRAGAGESSAGWDQRPRLAPYPAHRHEPFPLTDVQQAYWVGRSGLFGPGSVSCHLYAEFELPPMDVDRFEAAWNQVIRRHDMLRAVIMGDGRQRILPEVPWYSLEDASEAAAESPEALRQARRARMSHQVLPADQWPLFEMRLTRLSDEMSVLHVSVDRLVADAQSTRLFLIELIDRYEGRGEGYAPIELSFRDYVLHQRARQGTDEYERAMAYWRPRLATLPGGPDFPLAQDPGRLDSFRFSHREATIAADDWRRLCATAADAGVTPSALLLTVYAESLARFTRSPRFCLSLTLFDRQPLHPEVAAMVGDFTSIVPLEIEDARGGTFRERALRIQARMWDDLDHGLVGAIRIRREIQKLTGAQPPAVPVVFTSELGLDRERRTLSDGAGADSYMITQTPQVWLDHMVREDAGRLVLTWDGVDALLPPGMLDELARHYEGRLAALIRSPDAWSAHACAAEEGDGSAPTVPGGPAADGEPGERRGAPVHAPEAAAEDVATARSGAARDGAHAVRDAADAALPLAAERLKLRLERRAHRHDLDARPRIALAAPGRAVHPADRPVRASARAFGERPLAFTELASVLSVLGQTGNEELGKFRWPSAGALYPVQSYVWIRDGAVDGMSGGTYFVDPARSALVPVTLGCRIARELYGEPNRPLADRCAFTVYLVSCPEAMAPVYGDLTGRFELVEAGAMMQVLVERAAEAGVAATPIGDVYFPALAPLLGLGADRRVLMTLMFGSVVDPVAAGPGTGLAERGSGVAEHRSRGSTAPVVDVTRDAPPLARNGNGGASPPAAPPRSATAERPAPEAPSPAGAAALQEFVQRVWRELLDLEGLDPDTNVFDLGADSMHLVRARRRIHEETGCELDVAEFFQAPTARELAAAIAARRGGTADTAPAAPPALQTGSAPPSETLRIEDGRPLLGLHAEGRLPTVNAVALSYLSDRLLDATGLPASEIIRQWSGGASMFSSFHATHLGSIGVVTLPCFASELYEDPSGLLDHMEAGMRLAASLGATMVSLTGLLASATDYGRALQARIEARGLPTLTTGHATTAASVVMTAARALEECGRRWPEETLAVVGVGSIGVASTELLLATCGERPRRIVLADIPQREAAVRAFAARLEQGYGLQGRVSVALSNPLLSDEVYGASLILGATNFPGVIEVERLRPGSIVIDDSYPHSFDVPAAFRRFDRAHDVLFAVAGLLQSPVPVREVRHVPRLVQERVDADTRAELLAPHEDILPSCTWSGLLSGTQPGMPTTIGRVQVEPALEHYRGLAALGFHSPRLRCGGRTFEEWEVRQFAGRFRGEPR